MRVSLGAAAATMAMIVLTGPAPARTTLPEQSAVLAGIHHAVVKGWIDRPSAARYRKVVNRAAALIKHLPQSRRLPLAANLGQVAALSRRLKEPRALALFGQLAANNAYLARRRPPPTGTDITDEDGVVYRYFAGLGFEFHPLANFGALNAVVSAGNVAAARRLADALVAREVPQIGGGVGWEYYFDYSGGKAPWVSGMAQAVAAQALAGASQLVEGGSGRYMAAARLAFGAIPGRLVIRRSAGSWIKLYGFSRVVVLNAQLQSIVSLKAYADASTDAKASNLATGMERAALAELHSFDGGYWTYYSLPRTPSPLSYQTYVVRLLRKLAPDDPRFDSAASRFAAYAKQPPAFKVASSGSGTVVFWLSKPSSVEARSTAGATKRLTLYSGWHTLSWKTPKKAGTYSVNLTARDWAGNTASIAALPAVQVVAAPVWKVIGSSRSQTKSVLDAAEAGTAAGAGVRSVSSLSSSSFSVSAGLDNAAQTSLVSSTGLNGALLSVVWAAPATEPDAATVAQLHSVPSDQRLSVELVVSTLPTSDEESSELEAYTRSLVEQVPGIDDLFLAPAPSRSTAPAYTDALATVKDAAHEAANETMSVIAVGGMLDGAASPRAVLKVMSNEYLALGRSNALMDELAFQPAPKTADGAWTIDDYSKLVSALDESSLGGGIGVSSSLPIVISGIALATTIPADETASYPAPSVGASEVAQQRIYNQALRSAVCMPTVTGLMLNRLIDAPGDQSGIFYADGNAKTSAASVRDTASLAERGALSVCPGMGEQVEASTLVYPLLVSSSSSFQVTMACTRDCLYLITLEQAGGKPVLSKRGALIGGATPTAIKLPKGGVITSDASYRLHVRLLAQTNTGPMKEYLSPVIGGT
jgi:hypothetical protein